MNVTDVCKSHTPLYLTTASRGCSHGCRSVILAFSRTKYWKSNAAPAYLKGGCLFLVGYFSKIVSHYSLLIYSVVPKYPSNGLIEQEMNTVRPAILYLNNSGFHLGRPPSINQEQERRDIPIMKCKFWETSFDATAVCLACLLTSLQRAPAHKNRVALIKMSSHPYHNQDLII